MIKKAIFSFILCALFGPGSALAGLHPSFAASDLDLEGITDLTAAHGVNGIDFLSDGRMVVCTWGGTRSNDDLGKIIILSNVLDDNVAITADEIVSDLRDPVGMVVVDDVIYASDKYGVQKIDPETGDRELYFEVNYSGNYHEYHFSITHKDGFLYSALGQVWQPRDEAERGGVLKTDLSDGSGEYISGGLRESNGVGVGTGGEIFISDNQGHYVPTSKLVVVKDGAFFGMHNSLGPFNKELSEQEPPVAWLDHGTVSKSPTQPILIQHGIYQGQMLLGEYDYCSILRVFAERVNGVWQAAVFDFADVDGLTSGPNRFVYGPEGNIWIGGMPNGNGWGCRCGAESYITKLAPTAEEPFDMLAVRSIASGFEIEFTSAAGNSGGQANNYSLERWGFQPQEGYGAGSRQNVRNVNISSVSLSQDGMVAIVEIGASDLEHGGNLFPSTMFHFTLNGVTSSTGGSLYSNQAWYTLNEVGPATLGCMVQGDANYNAAADYDDGFQCANLIDVKDAAQGGPLFSLEAQVLRIQQKGAHKVELFDVQGKRLLLESGTGKASYDLKMSGVKGMQIIRVSVGEFTSAQKIILE